MSVQIFVTANVMPLFERTTKLGRYLKNGSMNITVIPEQFSLGVSHGYSQFAASPWLWEQLAEEHILLFQADSVLCSNSELDLEDFTQYDYIGAAPLGETWMNGGLSMRKRSTMLEITRTVPFNKDQDEEDVWFSHAVAAFPGAVIPSSETANTFSVGNVFSDRPFAMHKPRNAHGGIGDARMKALFEWCPEGALAGWVGLPEHETSDSWGGTDDATAAIVRRT
ncbi:hypothetical protein HDU90_006719 [Geranomyces variabilis]|nr:hypothetical protein HDU90_006719 [Geranomyces variabilis]